MATHEIRIPQLGETVEEGTVVAWLKQVGEQVQAGEPLLELSTDKVDTDVPSTVTGQVAELLAEEGDTVDVGAVIAKITTDGEAGASADGGEEDAAPAEDAGPAQAESNGDQPSGARSPAGAQPTPRASATSIAPLERLKELRLSPLVRRLIAEHELDLEELVAFAGDQRITREVVSGFMEQRPSKPAEEEAPAPAEAPAQAPVAAGTPAGAVAEPAAPGQPERIPFSRIRRLTAQHMAASVQTSPHVATGIEVDFEQVASARSAYHHFNDDAPRLTWLPFVCHAVVRALAEYERLNASVGDDELLVHPEVRLGIAVDVGDGLVVPVLRDVAEADVPTLGQGIRDAAQKARQGRLRMDDISGGTFTVTGQGPHGTLFTTPIINQPQVGILSVDGIARRPAIVRDEHGVEGLGIRHSGVLVLSWDHRAVDGVYAGAFLATVKRRLETTDWKAELYRSV